jgi:predicted HD superfamily hydrolase involved in NAD metabolism
MAVVADKEVLFTAPAEMAAAGYADLTAKIVAGADWIIADILKQDPIIPATWDVVQKDLRSWLADSNDLMAVFMGLAATGYAMQMHDDSRPASGSEHLFSHVWEMEGLLFNGEEVSHGFKVSVGTVVTLKLMQYFLDLDVEKAKELGLDKEKVRISAMLHDGAKYLDHNDYADFVLEADVPAPVVHAFLGAHIVQTKLGIQDEEIINAIRYHTSGRKNMSTLEKLIFVADMVEEGRDYQGVEYLRNLFYNDDFEKCFKECLSEELTHLLNKKQYIYKETLNAYEYYLKRK